jgi:hypothetical protein
MFGDGFEQATILRTGGDGLDAGDCSALVGLSASRCSWRREEAR